ncbi:MAG: PAS domain S-box protein [Asticcacaulis sp.]|nr:PAS domain S-box protein [Asticcacaulis sp.]
MSAARPSSPPDALFAELFDTLPAGIVVCDDHGLIQSANAFFRDLAGGAARFTVGQPFHHCLSRPSRFVFNAQVFPRLMAEGEVREVALDLIGPGFDDLPVLVNGHLDRDNRRMQFVVFPAGDRRAQERELVTARKEVAHARDYLQLAEELANVGHWHIDVASRETFFSPEIFRITGLDPAEGMPRVGENKVQFLPEDRKAIEACLETAIATGAPFTYTARLIQCGTGALRHVEGSGVCETGADGRVTGLFGVLCDITTVVEARACISASEARYRLLADNSNDIIATFNLDGVFDYLSPAVTDVLGFRPEELIGRRAGDVVIPEDREATVAAFTAFLTSGDWDHPPRIQYRARHRDGHIMWLEAHPTPLFDAGGQRVTGFQDVVRDITGQKTLEEALARASIEANAAAEAKAQFLATVSHELRTPLTSIIGFSALLRDLLKDRDDLRRFAMRIHNAGEGLLSLINDILDNSRLESGRVELDFAPANIADIATEVMELLHLQAESKDLTLVLAGMESLPPLVLVDDARLRQILLNLVGNAVKFTESGHVSVEACVLRRDDAEFIRLSVTDTGPGISEAGMARLFQKFTQVDRSEHNGPGGTGLGLSICKQLVELMNGRIGVTSEVGQGSTFWLELPVLKPAAEADVTVSDMPHRPGRILVVDDHEAITELVARWLEPWGHDVATADNGYEAVQACQHEAFDMVIMDINMPVMDGFEAARVIRGTCALNRDTPIIAMTAGVGAARLDACLAAGMNGLLSKPLGLRALAQALARHLPPDA